ncbi:MAG: glycoside hydrolase, partial [Edaphobacter sp.]
MYLKPDIRSIATSLLLLPLLALPSGLAQSAVSPTASASVPTFTRSYSMAGTDYSYTVVGSDPTHGGTTTIPTVLVPITLSFDAPVDATGRKAILDARQDVSKVVRSPIFQKYAFPSGKTQYADAMQRTAFYKSVPAEKPWHTLLSQPKIVSVKITVPVGYGYVLTSKRTGHSLAVVDIQFLQKELFKRLPKQEAGSLVVALTENTTYYAFTRATLCCSWGTHGVDTSAGSRQSFVLGSYLDPNVVAQNSDVQPLTQQIAQWFMDPLFEPLAREHDPAAPGN